MIEKRKFVRLQAPIGVIYKPAKKNRRQKPSPSLVKNISGGGVRIFVKEEVRCGDLLDLQIEIPHLEHPIHALGEVVWYHSLKEKDRQVNEAGIRFRDIHPKDLHRIFEYVYTIGIG